VRGMMMMMMMMMMIEYNLEEAESREEKRWMTKENEKR
jgi:hypothetical protein